MLSGPGVRDGRDEALVLDRTVMWTWASLGRGLLGTLLVGFLFWFYTAYNRSIIIIHTERDTYSVEISYEGGSSFSSSSSATIEGNASSPAARPRDGRIAATAGVGADGAGSVSGGGDGERDGVRGDGRLFLCGTTTILSLFASLISDILWRNK